MTMSSLKLRSDAQSIWQAGVDAVRSEQLVLNQVRLSDDSIQFGEHKIRLDSFDRICVVGAGKAAAGLAVGLETALATTISESSEKSLDGWVNVPKDCVLPTRWIHLHPARPPGVNEPTPAAEKGAAKILEMVGKLGPRDLCIVLIAGGGSALLPAPVATVSLADKLAVTRLLSHNGADIHQLNTVRKQLSRIKGGGLAAACRAGQLVTLTISDVLGDPLDVIASGPTVRDPSTPADAIGVLERFSTNGDPVPQSVWDYLRSNDNVGTTALRVHPSATNTVLANNRTAIDACAESARKLGYQTTILPTDDREPSAAIVAERLLKEIRSYQSQQPICLLSGGEPVVELAPPETRGKGGRNQQLVLAALDQLATVTNFDKQITLLSAGTDGEDGPTDAAGAMLWPDLVTAVASGRLELDDYLNRNDAYPILDSLDALIRSGPTHTNVCDIRVMLVS